MTRSGPLATAILLSVAGTATAAALGDGLGTAATPRSAFLVSRAPGGAAADGSSSAPSVSRGGRFVAFASSATNLSEADRDRVRDVFVRDLSSGSTTLVSRARARRGAAANRDSVRPRVSANGRYVAFESAAMNLSRADRDGTRDIFVRDLRRGTTVLASRASGRRGAGARADASGPSISGDGRYVAFESPAANLTRADDDSAANRYDVFVRDLRNETTELVSRASGARGEAGSASAQAMISASGRYVAFDSGAANLTPAGNEAVLEVYVRDLRRDRTVLVSRASGHRGAPARGTASQPAISGNGRYVAFESSAGNLSRDDREGFDLFVRDLRRRRTVLVTRAGGRRGPAADAAPECFAISARGRHVAFESPATNLSADDRDATTDVFVRDLSRAKTTLVSRAGGRGGAPANEDSGCPSVSAAARAVAFESLATNLSALDRDNTQDVFLAR